MKICVLGAGALGCAIGAALSEGGSEVWLVNRDKAHVDAMKAGGLTLVTPAGERSVRVNAATGCAEVGVVNLVIVLVKSFHTAAAIAGATALIGPKTLVLSLQNGLGHEEVLAQAVGRERVLAGKTYVGGVLLAPGKIISGTAGKQTIIGELDGQVSERALAIAAEFNRAGLQTTVSDNIVGTMWDKLLVNVSTGALSAITGLPYGPLYAVPEIKATAITAVAEAMAVARAAGIKLSFDQPEQPWIRAAEGLPADFKASMLQSLEKGSVTEIDFVNGAVLRWGERYKIPTPVNAALVACVKGIEKGLQ
jgi:2-dehydropantoate 2-reductase